MEAVTTTFGRARLLSRDELSGESAWQEAFGQEHKDRRFYELLADSPIGAFEFRFLALEDSDGRVRAIQPLFFVSQDLMAATGLRRTMHAIRKLWPQFMVMRMLMVGCPAGPAHLEDRDWTAKALHAALKAFRAKATLIVLKDFPAAYRAALSPFSANGYSRIPSMPMTRLPLNFSNFEDYMATRLSKVMRKNLRRKFRRSGPVIMDVVSDITPFIGEAYPLYLQVHERSALKFERLTKEFLCALGQRMPDRVRFFLWRLEGRLVAFSVCFVHGGAMHDEYLGLDYAVALDLHLYFRTFRDLIEWALAQGLTDYYSSPLNYDPKLHLRCELAPLDLYVTHTSRPLNWLFQKLLPLVQPTRREPILRQFPNADDL